MAQELENYKHINFTNPEFVTGITTQRGDIVVASTDDGPGNNSLGLTRFSMNIGTDGGKILSVNTGNDPPFEWITPSGVVTTFIALTDTPSGYGLSCAQGAVRVNAATNALEFSELTIGTIGTGNYQEATDDKKGAPCESIALGKNSDIQFPTGNITHRGIAIGAGAVIDGDTVGAVITNDAIIGNSSTIIDGGTAGTIQDSFIIGNSSTISVGGDGTTFINDVLLIGSDGSVTNPTSGLTFSSLLGIGHNVLFSSPADPTTFTSANAIGANALNRISKTTTLSGPLMMRKDTSVATGTIDVENGTSDPIQLFSSAEVNLGTGELNYGTGSSDTNTITIPTGSTFYPREVKLIATTTGTGAATGGSIVIGQTGNNTLYLNIGNFPGNATAGDVYTYTGFDSCAGTKSPRVGVQTDITNAGRFRVVWVGSLVEDE